MSCKVEKTKNANEIKMEITIEAEKFENAIKKVYFKNAKYFNIPGFRKGKAPQNIVEKYYGKEIFYEDAFVVATKPEVELGKYKGIEIEKIEYNVEESDIDNNLKQMQEKNARVISVETPVENGNIAVIDFEGFVDGKAFEGGKGENYSLEIGSGSFIPGFEDQVIGMKIDEEKDINVKFPDEYFSKDLAGKDATFKVKVHEIKKKELPELDDEFAKDVSEFDTLKELKDSIKERLVKENEQKAKYEKEDAVMKVVTEGMKVDIPTGMVEVEVDNMVKDMEQRMSYQGLKLEQYLKMLNKTEAEFRKDYEPQAIEAIKSRLALEAIIKSEKIEATEKDVKEKLEEMAKNYGKTAEELEKNDNIKEYIKQGIENEKAIEFLVENAKEVAKKKSK